MTENTLKQLFEYQKFEKNSRLAAMIADTESRYNRALNDDDLFFVAAAGEQPEARERELTDSKETRKKRITAFDE